MELQQDMLGRWGVATAGGETCSLNELIRLNRAKCRLSLVVEARQWSFENWEWLTEVNLSASGAVALPPHCFFGCIRLVQAVLPAAIGELGECSFSGCLRLASIDGPAAPVILRERALMFTPALRRLGWEELIESVGECGMAASGVRRLSLTQYAGLLHLENPYSLEDLRLRPRSVAKAVLSGLVSLQGLTFGHARISSSSGLHPVALRCEASRVSVDAHFAVAVEFALVLSELVALAGGLTRPALPP